MGDNGVPLAIGAGLLVGVGKGLVDVAVEEARTKRDAALRQIDQQFQREEHDKTRKHQTDLATTNDQNAARRESERDDRLAKREEDKDRRQADDPLRKAQTDYYTSQAEYNRAGRPRSGTAAAMLKIGANSGRIYGTDHDGLGDDDEPVVSMTAKDAINFKAVQTNPETKLEIARITAGSQERVATTRATATVDAAKTRADAARARQYAPDEITKLRTARDALPDDHPDRELYDSALRGIAQGKGAITERQIADIRQRTVKDVQTATDTRGKPLYATPEAQDAEVERRLNKVLPATQQPAPRPAAPAPRPAAPAAPAAPAPAPAPAAAPASSQPAGAPAPAPRDPAQRVVGMRYSAPDGRIVEWLGNGKWRLAE